MLAVKRMRSDWRNFMRLMNESRNATTRTGRSTGLTSPVPQPKALTEGKTMDTWVQVLYVDQNTRGIPYLHWKVQCSVSSVGRVDLQSVLTKRTPCTESRLLNPWLLYAVILSNVWGGCKTSKGGIIKQYYADDVRSKVMSSEQVLMPSVYDISPVGNWNLVHSIGCLVTKL